MTMSRDEVLNWIDHLAFNASDPEWAAEVAEVKAAAERLMPTGESQLPDPPEHLADAWRRFQAGEHVAGWEMSRLDEWRADCAQDAGF